MRYTCGGRRQAGPEPELEFARHFQLSGPIQEIAAAANWRRPASAAIERKANTTRPPLGPGRVKCSALLAGDPEIVASARPEYEHKYHFLSSAADPDERHARAPVVVAAAAWTRRLHLDEIY
jgi:hypothetical protein